MGAITSFPPARLREGERSAGCGWASPWQPEPGRAAAALAPLVSSLRSPPPPCSAATPVPPVFPACCRFCDAASLPPVAAPAPRPPLPSPQCPHAPGAPTAPQLHSRSHPRTRTAGPDPLGVPAGGTEPRRRDASTRSYLERSPRREALRGFGLLPGTVDAEAARDTGGVGRGAGAAAPRGFSSGDPAPRVSRNAARAELTGVGAVRGAWRSEVAINPVLATVPFIRAAGGRSSELGRQTSEECTPRAGGRGAQGTGRNHRAGLGSGLLASAPSGSRPDQAGAPRPLPPPHPLQEIGRDSPGSFLIPTSQDSGWKQRMGRQGGSQEVMFAGGAAEGPAERRDRGVWSPQTWRLSRSRRAVSQGLGWRLVLAFQRWVL